MTFDKQSVAQVKVQVQNMAPADQLALIPALRADTRKGLHLLADQLERQMVQRKAEEDRLRALWVHENRLRSQGYVRIAGTDEAGRGPLAGPVVAAAVILPEGILLPGLNDSKKLSEKSRQALASQIQGQALAYALGQASVEEIDRLNILHAAELAMNRALEALGDFSIVLVDGTNRLAPAFKQENIIGGDQVSASIAAASILAKVHRDALMVKLDELYPGYGLARHKGYGTADHYAALCELGPSPCHRRSFNLGCTKR